MEKAAAIGSSRDFYRLVKSSNPQNEMTRETDITLIQSKNSAGTTEQSTLETA